MYHAKFGLGYPRMHSPTEHKTFATMKKNNVTIKKNEVKKHIRPFCEQSAIAAEYKRTIDGLRPLAAQELQHKLDSDPETIGYKGTVVYLCDDKIYKIRVQRPESCDWMKRRLKDPLLKQYKATMKEFKDVEKRLKKQDAELREKHPDCVEHGFTIAFLT